MTGFPLLLLVLFGVAILVSVVTMLLGMRGRTGSPDQPREMAAETWRTAVPWLIGLALLMGGLLGLYWLMKG